jgi:hypothetical protein
MWWCGDGVMTKIWRQCRVLKNTDTLYCSVKKPVRTRYKTLRYDSEVVWLFPPSPSKTIRNATFVFVHSKNKGTTGVLWLCKVLYPSVLCWYPLGTIAKSQNQIVHEIATGLMLWVDSPVFSHDFDTKLHVRSMHASGIRENNRIGVSPCRVLYGVPPQWQWVPCFATGVVPRRVPFAHYHQSPVTSNI